MRDAGVTILAESDMEDGFLASLREASTVVFNEWRDKMPEGAADEIMADFAERLGTMN